MRRDRLRDHALPGRIPLGAVEGHLPRGGVERGLPPDGRTQTGFTTAGYGAGATPILWLASTTGQRVD